MFANRRSDSAGEGETFVGETAATTDAGGRAKFTLVLGDQASASSFTATTTSSDGATSELSTHCAIEVKMFPPERIVCLTDS